MVYTSKESSDQNYHNRDTRTETIIDIEETKQSEMHKVLHGVKIAKCLKHFTKTKNNSSQCHHLVP